MRYKHFVIYPVLVIFILILLVRNASLYRALKVTQSERDQVVAAFKKASEDFKLQAGEFVKGLQTQGLSTLQEIARQTRRYREMSETSESRISELAAERKSKYIELQRNQQDLSGRTLELLQLDDRLLALFQDHAQIQALHSARLIGSLEPLLKELGIDAES